jgi:hypothetical protein
MYRKTVLVLAIVFFIFSSLFTITLANGADYEYDIITISLPAEIFPGDPVTIATTFQNSGSEPIPEGTTLQLNICIFDTAETNNTSPETCPDENVLDNKFEYTLEEDISAGDFYVLKTTITAPVAGEYSLIAELSITESGEPVSETQSFSVTDPLPATLSRLFAGLGIFFAVMAVVSAGTEVVVDWIKIGLGLKSKPTAMQTLNALKVEIPGKLESLGVERKDVEYISTQFDTLSQNLNSVSKGVVDFSTLKKFPPIQKFLEPLETLYQKTLLENLPDIILDLLEIKGDDKKRIKPQIETTIHEFLKTFTFPADAEKMFIRISDQIKDETDKTEAELQELLTTSNQKLKLQLEQLLKNGFSQLQENAISAIPSLADHIAEHFPFIISTDGETSTPKKPFQFISTKDLETALSSAISSIDASDISVDIISEWLNKIADLLMNATADNIHQWLKQQEATLIGDGRVKVEKELITLVNNLGFSFNDKLEFGLKSALDQIEQVVTQQTDTYIEGTKKLLIQLEGARNDIQSPIRKFWRGLRKTEQLGIYGLILAILPILIAIFVLPLIPFEGSVGLWTKLLLGLIFLLLSSLITKTLGDLGPSISEIIGRFEKWFNTTIKGEGEDNQDYLGEPNPDIIKIIEEIGTTSLAAVLHKLETMHNDQEETRLRWLSAVTVVIGIGIAYLLRIDTITLLESIVPGLAEKLHVETVTVEAAKNIWSFEHPLTIGIVLTGLAASAGSKFWHDQLDRLQMIKKQSEDAAKLLSKVRGIIPTEEK